MYHSGALANKLTLKANEYVFGLNLKRLFSICCLPEACASTFPAHSYVARLLRCTRNDDRAHSKVV